MTQPPCILPEGDYFKYAMMRAIKLPLERCDGTVHIPNGISDERCYLPMRHSGPHGKCGGHDSTKCLRFKFPWENTKKSWVLWDTSKAVCCSNVLR